jgi:hypothetical protein
MRIRSTVLAALAAAVLSQGALAAPIWTESVNGDLSNDHLAPTALALGLGSNTVSGTTITGDRDYFTVVVPAGRQISSILLSGFDLPFDLAFVAIQSGGIITENPGAPNVANLLGWVHIGAHLLGTDILDDLGTGPGAIGFLPPLGPGTYSFWVQQTGGTLTSYGLDIVTVPEPTAAALLALGLLGLAFAGRRR